MVKKRLASMGPAGMTAAVFLLLSVALFSGFAKHDTAERSRNDDAEALRCRSLSNQLATEYTESQSEIAQETDETTRILNGLGLYDSQLAIMERMHRVAPTIGRYEKYGATLAMYLDLRRKGCSPDVAASTLGRIDTWMERWTHMD
jgi:hypothetical protein